MRYPAPHGRRMLALAVGAALLAGTACGGGGDDGDEAASAWSFTDDRGATVTLDARPERIVMFEDAAASLMDLGVRPVGVQYLNGIGGNQLFEGVDLAGVEAVGETCEAVNVEAVAALQPDLLVYSLWGEEVFCLTPEQVVLLEEIAPLVGIQAVGESYAIRDRYLELAGHLGADLGSDELAAKRERFEAAEARLRDVVEARPEISVIPVSIAPDWAGVAEPAGYPDLVSLRDRFGVRFVGPFDPGAPSTETYWQELSAETIADHRGDVILMDAKNEAAMEDKLASYPLWAALPEVAAGQVVPWFVPASFSYTRDAKAMEALADAIEGAVDHVEEPRGALRPQGPR